MGNPVMAIGWPDGKPKANACGESKAGRPFEAPLPINYSDPLIGVRPDRSGERAAEDSYLVDSASSHMLVSKITVVILELIHAKNLDFGRGVFIR